MTSYFVEMNDMHHDRKNHEKKKRRSDDLLFFLNATSRPSYNMIHVSYTLQHE